jgi:rubrerythrin
MVLMIDLETLSPEDLALVCRKAGEECGNRYYEIARAADPSDQSLRSLLETLADQTRRDASEISALEQEASQAGPARLDPDRVLRLIRSTLSSLSKKFGEGKLHRDNALFFAESLEEELSRFFRMMAEHARETKFRSLCHRLSERERSKLQFLREVVLA